LLILAIAYLENVLPPVPGDMIIVFGGYMAGLGRLDLSIVILLASLGGIAGFMTMYLAGVRLGNALLDESRFRWLPKKRVHAARAYLQRWGYRLVAANRFLSGLRSVISLSVGLAHKPLGPTLLFASLSAVVWTALLAVAGKYVGENWAVVGEYLKDYGAVVVALMVAFGLVQFARFLRSREAPSTPSP
jgi:membrane protein DedA with SNARE-associated domain